MQKKFLVFDVDNTVTEKLLEISNEMASVLNGIESEIAFISGTNIPELRRMISSKLSRKHHLLGNTGTHYVIIEDGNEKEIVKEELSEKDKRNIIHALKNLKKEYGLIPLTSEDDQIQDRGSQITLSVLGRNAPPEKKSAYDPKKEKRRIFVEYLKDFLKDDYEIAIGGTTSIDITKRGSSKGESMLEFIRINNLGKNGVLFFGDQLEMGGNDYSVKEKGFKCIEVKNPEETIKILEKLYKKQK